MQETLNRLLDVLTPRADSELEFTAQNMHPEAFRVYGGQVLAQCISAAAATVAVGRGGRGLAQGSFFTREGKLVANTVQQGLVRKC